MAKCGKRALKHVRAAATIDWFTVAQQRDLELREVMQPIRRPRAIHSVGRTEQISTMETCAGDTIGSCKAPARENRLYDLEPVRNPFDAAKNGGLVHTGFRRSGKLEGYLRLDARLGKGRKCKRLLYAPEVMNRAIVHVAPNWCAYAVLD